jgi:hypothetical protein
MKKITTLFFLSVCAFGFSQSKDIKAPANPTHNVQLPAAYYNSTATSVGEELGEISTGDRDLNVKVPFTGTYYFNAPNALIYDNGPYFNTPGSPNVSLLESATLGMNSLGSNVAFVSGFSMADDVVLTADYDVTSIDVFAYQTGSIAPSITAVYMQVWDGDPSGGGASVIWGDLSTDILDDAVYSDANRASETTPTDTSRQINRVTANTTGLSLTAGTYWIEYAFEGSGASGPWAPPISILGETTTGNALQNNNGVYAPLEDSGTFTPQGLPFVMYGDVSGGGGGTACNQEHILVGDANGGIGSSVDSDYKSASDIVVAAGQDFTIETIEVPFLTFAPEDAPTTANVVYYEDAAGLPGTMIGSETVVPTILTSAPWINPVAYEFTTSLAMTPFTFPSDAGSDTTYWIEISMGTATNQATVFWEYTNTTPVEGEPVAQFNALDGFWTVPDATQEVVYNYIGTCGGTVGIADNTLGGFSYYPNPTTGVLSLKSVNNIDTVSIFNLLGQKVLDAKIGATTSELNISNLKTGTYLMQVTVNGQTETFKVLKN